MKRSLFLTVTILAVSACQSTGLIPMDHGIYMIGKKDGSPGLGVSFSNKAEVYKEANAFSHKKGFEVETIKIIVSPAKLASTNLEFKCVPAQE